jgi:T5orf172 domain
MTEIVYILTNEAMPGLVKIGRATDDLAGRIRGLYSTGVPLSFELFYACEVKDSRFVETQLHDAFGDHRVSKSREFFRLAPERAKAALSIAAIREIKLGDEIFETSEEKAEVETAKRRARFQFSMIGIKPGTELRLEKDPNITCTTVDDKNQVNFKGNVTSLSDAALQAIQSLGYEWDAVSGPWEWTYQGKRLDEIRREIEEKAD